MEAPIPKPRKSKHRKRSSKTKPHDNERKENEDTEETSELASTDLATHSFLVRNDIDQAGSSLQAETHVSLETPEESLTYTDEFLNGSDTESMGPTLNDLDATTGREEDPLRRSQLNVVDCNADCNDANEQVNNSAEECQSTILPQSENEAYSANNVTQLVMNDEQTYDPESDQLYPSLDDCFYQNLQEHLSFRQRSGSQQSSYGTSKEDLDALSMQNAEAQLDYIAPTEVDEIANDSDLYSFDTLTEIDGQLCTDGMHTLNELNDTLHHHSLQTLVYDDQYEQKLQSCYLSDTLSPAQSMPNFEELNKELLINELKCYYHNSQLASNEDFIRDFVGMCQNQSHELFLLISRYQKARQNYLIHNALIENHISKYKKSRETVWTFTKEKKIETGYCADHMKVTHTEQLEKAHCHQEIVKEISDELTNISDNCSKPLALLQYDWNIAFHKVEQFMVKVMHTCPPLFCLANNVTSYVPGLSIPWDHVNHTAQLRVCISILFHFKRQKITDDVFEKDINRWLNILVSMLLRVATLLDHRFLLNHLLRCPSGFSFWGNNYLQFMWSEVPYNTDATMGKMMVDHFFLMYLTMILPLPERDTMLAEYEPPEQEHDPSEWALLDELGEVSCDGKQLLERDYLELLGQFNFGMFYRELLKFHNPQEFLANAQRMDEQEMMTLFSMCLQCIAHIREAFAHLDFTRYRNFCQRNANIMTTFMRFVSDIYHFYEGYGGKYERWSVDVDRTKLLTVHNHVIEEGFRCLAETSNVSLWQFLTDLPYHRISIKVLWKLYGFLHQVNPEKHIKGSVLREGSAYEIVTKLYKTARFQKRLESLADEDCTFMVNVFCKMALSREIDKNFVKVIGLDIYHIGVTSTVDKQSTDHACKTCLSSIIDHCPEVVSVIINNLEKQTLRDLPTNLTIFRGLSLLHWLPSDSDFSLLTTWLQTTPLTSMTNQLSRVILKGLNWGSHEDKLFIPSEYHRKVAVVVASAHSYHLPDRPGYLIHSAAPDFAKHVSNSEKNLFVSWCWDLLLNLCLHKTELSQHNALSLKILKQQQRHIRRQKSEGSLESSASKLQRQASLGVEQGETSETSFIGKWGKFPYKMRKESGLATLCDALRTNGEMAAFVALSITTIGHAVVDFQADGIQLLLLLQKNTSHHHRALFQVLSNLLSVTLKNKCLHLLIQLPDYLPLVQGLAKAEHAGTFNGREGRAAKPFVGFVISKLSEAYDSSAQEGNLCLKFWVNLFFSISNFHTDLSIVSIMDSVFRVVFARHGDEEWLCGELKSHLAKCVDNARRNSSKILSIVSWFSSAGYVTSLLQPLSAPGELPYWGYYVTKMECEVQYSTGLVQMLTEVLFTNPDWTIDVAFRRAILLVDREELTSLTISNLAIYRWGTLLQSVAMEHPLLPFAWREFYQLYFNRVAPETAGVGYRYYQGMFQVRDLRAIKQRLVDASKHFELDELEEDITEAMLFRSKLSHFFLSLSLWTDETRLHEANLFIPGLPQQYSGIKLADIIQNVEAPWYDMVDTARLETDISVDISHWTKYNGRRYTPRRRTKPDETAEYLVDQLYSYVSKNMVEAAAPPELVLPQCHVPSGPDFADPSLDTSSLIATVGPYFCKLKLHAEQFAELTTKLENLNNNYIEEVPTMYYNRNSQRTEMVHCYSRIGALGRCSAPAIITVTSALYHENTAVCEGIADNRVLYEETLQQVRRELDNDVCITAMFLEKIVVELYHRAELHQPLGRDLFYHVVDHLTSAVQAYPPSQQIYAFSIDCLGKFFIRNNAHETLNLLNNILTRSDFATVLAPHFQPNQGYENFVNVYSHVINSLANNCNTDIGFTILSKFDIRSWLSTQHANTANSKQLLTAIFTGFDIYPYSEDNTSFMMFYDTLKIHLRHVLMNRLCALLQHTIDKALEISSKRPHHQAVWKEILGVLSSDHAQEMLTLNTCHRVLYELSKYFLQFKKGILSSTDHDLYTHWSNYIPNLLDIFSLISTSYINKASYLAPTEEQAACVFMITCAVFAPWILVYEEACLPWSEPHIQEADAMLETFTKMLAMMTSQISDVTPLLNRFWWYYMDILGHPIVPSSIITTYYSHFTTLPWDKFVPSLDILHSLLKCVRNNRNNINFVIYLMTQVNWHDVVGELKKESHAFDMLIDVLITFALSQDIFTKFGNEFIALFRQFKSLDLSLVSDEGFSSIMSRIDKTVQQNQYIQSVTGTGHLIQFMGALCRFSQQGVSYIKQITYFKHVVNITTKTSNSQYGETLVQSLLYNLEQVFYTSCSEKHISDLAGQLFWLFNTTPCDQNTHQAAVSKIESALKDRGSIKEGYSFSQLSLYYLSVLTTTVHNVKMQAVVAELLVESYFTHCENSYPVLSVSWTTLHERFLLSDMNYDNFVNHSVNESCPLNIFLYTTHLLIHARNMDEQYSAAAMLVDSSSRIIPKPREEQKMLLLWFKIFDIMVHLHETGIRSSAISSIIKQLPSSMLKLAEDRDTGGLFNNWFGKKSKYSLEFRLATRLIATFVLHQINKDGSLRLTAGTRHNVTSEAGKAMDNIRSLVGNKSYSAHINTLQHCISTVLDPSRTFLHTIELLRFLTMTFYGDNPYLTVIIYSQRKG